MTLYAHKLRDSTFMAYDGDDVYYPASDEQVLKEAEKIIKKTGHAYQCAACGGRISLQQESPPAHGVGPCPFCSEEVWTPEAKPWKSPANETD